MSIDSIERRGPTWRLDGRAPRSTRAVLASLLGAVARRAFFLFGVLTPAWASADVGECAGLGAALTEHSCFHAELGPFNTVSATVGTTAAAETPDIDAVHTEHRVILADPSGHNLVTYSPVRSGQWIVFLGRDVPLAVYDPEGRTKPILRTDRGTTGCDALPIAHAFELLAGERYGLVLGPSAEREVVVIVEYVEDFLVTHGRDKDGDGYGDPNDTTAFTVCSAPEGYAEKLGDCNDDDPEIYPGAQETCDDVDRNCNGIADDVGLRCRAGRGACVSTGQFTCEGVAWGDPVQCDAVEVAPSEEQCNGVDDDCNGVIDDGPALCGDPDAPTCVRHGDGAFCGCLVDLDCGDRTSGRVCDTSNRTCRDGCSTTLGGNGCPEGLVCSSDDEGIEECSTPDVVEPNPDPEPESPLLDSDAGCSCRASNRGRPNQGFVGLLGGLGVVWMSSRRRRRKVPALSSLALLFGGAPSMLSCGGRVLENADELEPEPTCVPLLARPPAQHACSHGAHGPFEAVVASAVPDAAPAIDRIHIPYQIEFSEGASGWLGYRPTRQGAHVFFTGSSVELTIVAANDPSDSKQPILVERSDSCDVFSQAQVAELSKGTSYRILAHQLDAIEQPLLLFVEHLSTFGNRAFLRQCEEPP